MLDKLQLEPILLFASKPDLDELCTVTVRVDQRSTGVSPTQPRVLKCRETIFTEPGVMASPSPDFFDCFNVVMPQSLYKTGRLQTRMKNNQLQVSSAFRATPSVYQTCLHYTMLARLAPLWNKAGDWLIQGRDFLGHTGCASAINLNLSPLEVQSLLYNASRQAGEVAVPGFWCHVLPSMKKGRLCSVSLSIPADSPFTSYRDLKRHWKNTYGYRLPETDDDIFYGQISFWATGGKQFTYPSVCLRAGPIQPVPRVEPRPILSAFLQDLHVKLPSVCGQPVKFQPQLRHTCAALYPASQEVRGPAPNLSKRSSAASSAPPLRHVQTLSHLTNRSQAAPSTSDVAKLKASASTLTQPASTGSSGYRPFQPASQTPLPTCSSDQPGLVTSQKTGNEEGFGQGASQQGHSGVTSTVQRNSATQQQTRNPVLAETGDTRAGPTDPSQAVQSVSTYHAVNKPHVQGSSSTDSQVGGRFVTKTRLYESTAPRLTKRLPVVTTGTGAKSAAPSPVQVVTAGKEATCPALSPVHVVTAGKGATFAALSPVYARPVDSQVSSTVNKPDPPRLVPVFKPRGSSSKKKTVNDDDPCKPNAGNSTKIIPTFTPKLVKSSSSGSTKQTSYKAQQKTLSGQSEAQSLSCSEVSSSTEVSSRAHSSSSGITSSTPAYHPSFVQQKVDKARKSPSVTSDRAPPAKTPLARKLKLKMMESVHDPTASPKATVPSGKTLCNTDLFSGLSPSPALTPGMQGKRKAEGQSGSEERKRARSKPQVQDVDVELLAKTNQLNTANTVTLMAWLKSRGVHCKAKDKKGDLVERVRVLLALTSSEP